MRNQTKAESYIENVRSAEIGEQIVPSWVKSAIQRHLADLERSKDKSGLVFCRDTAWKALRWAHKNATITEPWQQAVIWILAGWHRTT